MEIPLQETSQAIYEQKYALFSKEGVSIDKGIEGTFRRVAKALAQVEKPEKQEHWEQRFLWALQNGCIPAGRIMSNAGASEHKPKTSQINCVVSRSIDDSIEGILQAVKEAGMALSAGCGIGYDFTTLRPKGAYVGGVGASTGGALGFMDIFDSMCFTIASAGGRRGAQMGVLDICHPDVLEFIKAKRENGRLRQFNLSLLITDKFMQAVEEDKEWSFYFPVNKRESHTAGVFWKSWPLVQDYMVTDGRLPGQVLCREYSKIRARELWDIIMRSTYDYAEPGFIMIDQVNRMNNNYWCEEIRTTNPCVTADTWVQTSEGPRTVSELIGVPFTAKVDGEDFKATGFFSTGTRSTILLDTREGYKVRLTENHKVLKDAGEWCEAGNLLPGDKVVLHSHGCSPGWEGAGTESEGYLLGLLVGDGTLKEDKAVLSAWPLSETSGKFQVMEAAKKDASEFQSRADFSGWHTVAGREEWRMSFAGLKDLAAEFGMGRDKQITQAMEKASSSFSVGFLRGFFDCDSSVQGTQEKGVSLRLAQSDLLRLEAVQRMLLRLGILSRIYKNRRKAGEYLLPDGKGGSSLYPTKAQHELVIVKEGLRSFQMRIGFKDTDKSSKLDSLLSGYKRNLRSANFAATVLSVEQTGKLEEVYDVSVPGKYAFDGNGLYLHNCGEQPLPPYGSCLLGSINLTRFVTDPFNRPAFDWNGYREAVRVFTRMLDNVVEVNGLVLPEQQREIVEKRRHGMGYLGLGSALTMMKMKYGSPESLKFVREVTRVLAIEGWDVGAELADEKRSAPMLETEESLELFIKSEYMQRVFKNSIGLERKVRGLGMRFTHHTSIAPTGTIALSFGNNCSNGIEPSFSHEYLRNVIVEGENTKRQVKVRSYELLLFRQMFGEDVPLPDYFSTSESVTPQEHIAVQAAAQYWVDSSISKTINVPTSISFEDFKGIYMDAYKAGLKGCTTFRFNPEAFQGVLVNEKDLKDTTYVFVLEDGTRVELKGDQQVEYDGAVHGVANLYDALKEGYYGKH